MARTVRLRKCGEHPDCQLESLNDGPFEHTPKNRTVEERFQRSSDRDRLEHDLGEGIARADKLAQLLADQRSKADDILSRIEHEAAGLPRLTALQRDLRRGITQSSELSNLLKQQHAKAEELISRVQAGTEGLPQVVALQADAARTGERLAEGQLALEALALRLAHMADNATHLLDEVDDRLREIRNAEDRIDTTLGKAEEFLSHISERMARVESLFEYLEQRRSEFNRVEELFSAVDDLRNLVKVETEAWQKKTVRFEADVKHEREERLQAHEKIQRQIQTLSGRISDA